MTLVPELNKLPLGLHWKNILLNWKIYHVEAYRLWHSVSHIWTFASYVQRNGPKSSSIWWCKDQKTIAVFISQGPEQGAEVQHLRHVLESSLWGWSIAVLLLTACEQVSCRWKKMADNWHIYLSFQHLRGFFLLGKIQSVADSLLMYVYRDARTRHLQNGKKDFKPQLTEIYNLKICTLEFPLKIKS